MDKKIIATLATHNIVTRKIHYAQGTQRRNEGHRWFGWGRRNGQIVYFGSYYGAKNCQHGFTISLDPFGTDIDCDCRK